jgi:O-acetylhomoserine (thiol)-lyase
VTFERLQTMGDFARYRHAVGKMKVKWTTDFVAEYLKKQRSVTRVIYPGMDQPMEIAARADRYLKGGRGGLVGFELKGGVEAGRRFIDALKLVYHVANIGDVRTLAIHPASTTHSQLSDAEQRATGVTPGYVRLSVGIEHADDIIADLDQALAASEGRMAKAA